MNAKPKKSDSQIVQLEDDASSLGGNQVVTEESKTVTTKTNEPGENFWSMDFDGDVSKEGAGGGVWVHNHKVRYS